MKYYFNFTTGLIDGLLTRLGHENYTAEENESKALALPPDRLVYSKYLKKKVIRNTIKESEAFNPGHVSDKSRNTGSIDYSLDERLHNFFYKEELIPDFDPKNINYSKEFKSPFDNITNVMLCFFKLITGIQSITRQYVVIDKKLLEKLDLDGASVMDWKIAFDKRFYNQIVSSHYEDGKWYVKLGSNCLKVGDGPGHINILIQKENIINKIEQHHQELLKEYSIA